MADPIDVDAAVTSDPADRLETFFRTIESGLKLDETVVQQIGRIADQMFEHDGEGGWSVAERIAGALLNDRLDWLPDGYTNIMMALNRLGPGWREGIVEAAIRDWNGGW